MRFQYSEDCGLGFGVIIDTEVSESAGDWSRIKRYYIRDKETAQELCALLNQLHQRAMDCDVDDLVTIFGEGDE